MKTKILLLLALSLPLNAKAENGLEISANAATVDTSLAAKSFKAAYSLLSEDQKRQADIMKEEGLRKLQEQPRAPEKIRRSFICLAGHLGMFAGGELGICQELTISHRSSTVIMGGIGLKVASGVVGVFLMNLEGPAISLNEGIYRVDNDLSLTIGVGGYMQALYGPAGIIEMGGLTFGLSMFGDLKDSYWIKILETTSTKQLQARKQNGIYRP